MATLRRNSRQRMLVYDAVKASHEHPNAEEVYQVVKQQLPDISLGPPTATSTPPRRWGSSGGSIPASAPPAPPR